MIFSSLIGKCKFEGIYFVFFSSQKEERNPNPHCSKFASPHKLTLGPMFCRRAEILSTHAFLDELICIL
jgi:hypothetical protein